MKKMKMTLAEQMTRKFLLMMIKILNKQPVRNVWNMTLNGTEYKKEIVQEKHH